MALKSLSPPDRQDSLLSRARAGVVSRCHGLGYQERRTHLGQRLLVIAGHVHLSESPFSASGMEIR